MLNILFKKPVREEFDRPYIILETGQLLWINCESIKEVAQLMLKYNLKFKNISHIYFVLGRLISINMYSDQSRANSFFADLELIDKEHNPTGLFVRIDLGFIGGPYSDTWTIET